jgi:hypothetical protein
MDGAPTFIMCRFFLAAAKATTHFRLGPCSFAARPEHDAAASFLPVLGLELHAQIEMQVHDVRGYVTMCWAVDMELRLLMSR